MLVHHFFFLLKRRPPRPPLFPYTTLFRSRAGAERRARDRSGRRMRFEIEGDQREHRLHLAHRDGEGDGACVMADRKSTRLNSSHVAISYAVFCLKKKKTKLIEDIYICG